MKPDGVATAVLEPMEALDADSVTEPVVMGEEPNQVAPQMAAVGRQGEMGHGEARPEPTTDVPTKTGNGKAAADPKAKNKATAPKTKAGPNATAKTSTGPASRPTTAQSRVTNGVSKPQANGLAKKTTGSPEKKATPTQAASKKPGSTAGAAPSNGTRVGEKKPAGITRPTNGVKSTPGTTAKKAPAMPTNGVKTTPAGPTKKPMTPRPTSAATAKPSSPAAALKPDRPPVSKPTRPATGAGSRPTSAAARPASASTAKSSTSTAKPVTPTTKTTTSRPASAKASSTTPSAGQTPTSLPSKTTTPIKKDSTKPVAAVAKRPAPSPLARPSTAKATKPETPKSASKQDSTPKKPAASSKAADPKKVLSKPTPSKDVSASPRTPGTKPAGKASAPKKTVGSSTPMAVKRGPKPTPDPTAKEDTNKDHAAVAAAAVAASAVATAASAAVVSMAISEEPMVSAALEKEPVPPQASQPEAASEASIHQLSAHLDFVHLGEPTDAASYLGTTVMSPPCSPTGPISPAREPQNASPVLDVHVQPDPLVQSQSALAPHSPVQEEVMFPPDEFQEDHLSLSAAPGEFRTMSPVTEPRNASPVLDMHFQPDHLTQSQSAMAPHSPVHEEEEMFQPDEFEEDHKPSSAADDECRPTSPVVEPQNFSPVLDVPDQPDHLVQSQSVMAPQSPVQKEVMFHSEEYEEDRVHFSAAHPAFKPMFEITEPNFSPMLDVHDQPGSLAPSQSPLSAQSLVREEVMFQSDELHEDLMASSAADPTFKSMSPVRETQNVSALLDMEPDALFQSHSDMAPRNPVQEEEMFQPEEPQDVLLHSSEAPPAFGMSPPIDDFPSMALVSPSPDHEEAVEKADEEINDDDDDEQEDEEEERQLGKPYSLFVPAPVEAARPVGFDGAAGWHGEDVSGMDSEDVSSISSRLQGASEMSSTQHTGLLEGTLSSDALVDSSLRGSEGDGAFMGSPNVETLANEEEEEDEEEDERVDVDDMDLSSERAEDHQQVSHPEHEDEEDEDEEMPSEGVTESGLESCGNADEDDFTEEERLDNLNRSHSQPPIPPSSAWGQTNPFTDPWAQPPLSSAHTASSPLSDHGAVDPETPTQSPAQAWLDLSTPSLKPQSDEVESATPVEASAPKAPPAVGMSQSSTLSGNALAAHSSSETSTPEELRDYDSSSGVESRSDKQQTPVPSAVQPDLEQDLGIHLERGDEEEEEAETLPADEVLGAGPPTAPASVPTSPSTSGDEASDTEGEMQINDPDAPVTMDDSADFDSPPPAHVLPALEEDEEVAEAPAGEGEEDGGGGTPQSANSVASYGFDCTPSNSNAHSTAESCGKSPGIFSLENEDQLPEEAKDPCLIKELTLPAAAAQAENLLGGPVALLPLGQPGDQPHYMLGGKMGADGLEDVDPLEASLHLGQHGGEASEGQPPYYSAICDKTDSFLAGNV